MTTQPGTTMPEDDTLSAEQQAIQQLENEDQATRQPEQPAPAPAPKAEEPVEAPVDPRAARMEAIAENARTRDTEELQAAAEVMAPVVTKTEEPVVQPERMIKLKVRGEIKELPESEVIAMAQKVDAADDYLGEAKQLLKDAKEVSRPAPVRVEPEPVVDKIDRIAAAVEKIQTGADPSEVRQLLDEEIGQRVRDGIAETLSERQQVNQDASFDANVDQGYEQVRTDFPDLAKDSVAINVVTAVAGGLEGQLIAKYLSGVPDPALPNLPVADQQTISAFAAVGITAEGVVTYRPRRRARPVQGHAPEGLPPPASRRRHPGAGKPSPKGSAPPRPAARAGHQRPLDRTARKEAIQQPERVYPENTNTGQFPPSEPERATDARAEMRGTAAVGRAHRALPRGLNA
jgi:hypothetical protein